VTWNTETRNLVAEGKQYHVALGQGDVGRYVFVPGDPGRVPLIAKHFDDARHVATNREYVTWTGTLDGVPVSATSTGIGSPSAAIAMEELAAIGADTFLRVGKSGGLQEHLPVGSLVIATGAVRDEGTSRAYVPIEFPAVADLSIVNALVAAAEDSGIPYHYGIVESKDAFYAEIRPESLPLGHDLVERWAAYRKAGVLASEMEAAALFTIASTKRLRAGCLLQVADNQFAGQHLGREVSMEETIAVGIAAIRSLIRQDQAKAAAGVGPPA
jgi:uridine phosphorylase